MQTVTEKLYHNSIAELKSKFDYTNQLAIPKVQMVSINVGIKAVDSDNKLLSYLLNQVSNIAGQKAVLTRSKKAISTQRMKWKCYRQISFCHSSKHAKYLHIFPSKMSM